MKEKATKGKNDIKINTVEFQAIKYSISGSYDDYEFHAIVADYDAIDGLDAGCICALRVERRIKADGESEPVYEFGPGHRRGLEASKNAEACARIRTFLENLPLDRHEKMLSLGDA